MKDLVALGNLVSACEQVLDCIDSPPCEVSSLVLSVVEAVKVQAQRDIIRILREIRPLR